MLTCVFLYWYLPDPFLYSPPVELCSVRAAAIPFLLSNFSPELSIEHGTQ